MRVLVTGAAGRIGRATLELLSARGPVNALVLDDPGDLPADLVVTGDASDPRAVAAALEGADAVIHLAAIPTPEHEPAERVFAVNTQSTFTVLEQAGRAGVRRVCIAGSQAASGIPFAAGELHPAYAPIDAALPSQAEDPYALSKLVDEVTAGAMARRHGMSVVSVRLPFVGGFDERLLETAARCAADPSVNARGLWAYLETRDAARACVLALDVSRPGVHPVLVAAPETMAALPTEELMRRFHPRTELRRPMPGRTVPIDLTVATDMLGFIPEYSIPR
ncbi:NAD-dependent epimerase/dehydratase family protein [Nonomuraea sp. NPDC050556]|uniref:NAD-dependent epimerase/dehydratase family protein n=1 Tax=Nonomuraea sp. NPDC050556 TaxID=3364369 RepID=UPI00378F4532